MCTLQVYHERWPLKNPFTISRGSKIHADVVVVRLFQNDISGHGECTPYARYGESVAGVVEQIEKIAPLLSQGITRSQLLQILPAGAARNAVDCALWDLECKRSKQHIWEKLNIKAPVCVPTAYTLSLDTPEQMRKEAVQHANRKLLKLKLGHEGDIERVSAVRDGAPRAQLIVDANEAWDSATYVRLVPELQALGVTMIEQPFPSDQDDALATLPRPIPICADESCHESSGLAHLVNRYDMINIKLDKTGGLTEALHMQTQAREHGLKIMVGCMVSTSLSMAPAMVLAQYSDIVDLDGPLLLQSDRSEGLLYRDSHVWPSQPALWG